jgi:glycosyltransferase involved in cell wall biosynthesis
MKSKKLLYITPAFPVGGLEKLLILLANSFSGETEKQIVISLSNNNVLQHELKSDIQFVALPRKSRFDTSVILKLRKIIQAERPDAFISLNFFGYFFLKLAMIGIRPKIKSLIIYQTTIHENKKEHLLHKLYTSLLKKDDCIIAASRNQVKYTLENYRIPENKISVIYNGIDTNHWHLKRAGDKDSVRNEYGIPTDAKVIVIAAAFRPEKNHVGAVRALQMLRENYEMNAYLLLVGDGNTKMQTEEITRQLEMQRYVKFAGMQKDLRPFYWAANVFSLCSYAVETFSVAALEAMSCGLPCVLTNIGGAAEMIQDGVNGFLCEPEDKSISDAWWKTLQAGFSPENIHQFLVDNFAAETMLEQYRKIL